MNQLASKIKFYLRVYWQISQFAIKQLLEYRLNVFIQGGFIIVYLVGLLMMLEIIFSKTQSLGGWSKAEVFLLYGVSSTFWGFIEMIYFQGLMRFMSTSVSTGEFDMLLTKPLDSQFLMTFLYLSPTEFVYPSISLIFTGWVLFNYSFHISLISMIAFAIAAISCQLLVLFLFLCYSSLAFFITRSQQTLRMFQTLGDHSQYPTTIYPNILKYSLLSFLAIGLVAFIPTSFLLQKISPIYLLPLILITVITFILNRIFWKIGLRQYASASS